MFLSFFDISSKERIPFPLINNRIEMVSCNRKAHRSGVTDPLVITMTVGFHKDGDPKLFCSLL